MFLSVLHRNNNRYRKKNVADLKRECRETISCFAKRSLLVTCQKWLTGHPGECFIPVGWGWSNCVPYVCHKSCYTLNFININPGMLEVRHIDVATEFELHLLGWQTKTYCFYLLQYVYSVLLKLFCLIFQEGSSTCASRNSRTSERK